MNRTPVLTRPRENGLGSALSDIFIDYPIRMGIRTWLVMLALGAVHHDVFPRVPALGFWQVLFVLWLIDGVLSTPMFWGVKYGIREADK